MTDLYLMKCGHVTSAKDDNNNPVCPICVGKTEYAEIIDDIIPDLTGRKARCFMCGKETDSHFDLPYFKYNNDKQDTYYCGCGGWD